VIDAAGTPHLRAPLVKYDGGGVHEAAATGSTGSSGRIGSTGARGRKGLVWDTAAACLTPPAYSFAFDKVTDKARDKVVFLPHSNCLLPLPTATAAALQGSGNTDP